MSLKWKGIKRLLEAGGTLWLKHMTALLCARQKDGRSVLRPACVYEVVCSFMHEYVWALARMCVGSLYVGMSVYSLCERWMSSGEYKRISDEGPPKVLSLVTLVIIAIMSQWHRLTPDKSNKGISLRVKIPLTSWGYWASRCLKWRQKKKKKKCRRKSFFSSSAEG